MSEANTNSSRLLPARQVLQRYGIVDRTLARWLNNPTLNFPRPLIVNRFRYFSEAALIEWEQSATASNKNSEVA